MSFSGYWEHARQCGEAQCSLDRATIFDLIVAPLLAESMRGWASLAQSLLAQIAEFLESSLPSLLARSGCTCEVALPFQLQCRC